MKCPQCGTWTEVRESVLREDGSRRRRYQCANLHKFSTVEIMVEGMGTGRKDIPGIDLQKRLDAMTNERRRLVLALIEEFDAHDR